MFELADPAYDRHQERDVRSVYIKILRGMKGLETLVDTVSFIPLASLSLDCIWRLVVSCVRTDGCYSDAVSGT